MHPVQWALIIGALVWLWIFTGYLTLLCYYSWFKIEKCRELLIRVVRISQFGRIGQWQIDSINSRWHLWGVRLISSIGTLVSIPASILTILGALSILTGIEWR